MQGNPSFAEAASQRRIGNRRITVRYRCAPATAGKVATSDDNEFQRAWIDNLSKTGVGLFLSKPIAEGNIITVQLKGTLMGVIYELTGQVMHATLREPYGWFIGIEFVEPLNDDTLDALL